MIFLSSTPKYNRLYEAFGWDIPVYIHCPHIMKDAQHKLSKRNGDASFEDLLTKGYLKDAVINYIALLGWNPGTTQELFTLEELAESFDYRNINKAPAIFDTNKLKWMNGEYIRKLSPEEFQKLAMPYYKQVLKKEYDFKKISELLHNRTEVFGDIPEQLDFLDTLPEYDINLYVHKKMKTDTQNSLASLKEALPVLKALDSWTFEAIHDSMMALVEKLGIKNGQLLWPIRTALSGKSFTPGGAFEIADLLGKEESIKRIEIGMQKLS